MISQYIQYPQIAKDFANYLELYQKYQKDYQVDEILHGVIREAACRKLEKAPFDERLSVISLLTAKLNDGFLALSMSGGSSGAAAKAPRWREAWKF